jgi:hypothetical protein
MLGWLNAQMVEHLDSKCEALSSRPSTAEIKQQQKNRTETVIHKTAFSEQVRCLHLGTYNLHDECCKEPTVEIFLLTLT